MFLLKGTDRMRGIISVVSKTTPMVVGHALRDELQEVELPEAIRRTPIDTGDLRASEKVTGPSFRGGRINVTITAGGPGVDYAVEVHENLGMFHDIGEAKFIESTLMESAPHLLARAGRRIRLL